MLVTSYATASSKFFVYTCCKAASCFVSTSVFSLAPIALVFF